MILIKIWICNGFDYFGFLTVLNEIVIGNGSDYSRSVTVLVKIWICNGFD